MSNGKRMTEHDGEVLRFGPTTVRVLEDGSGTDNRISTITSTMAPHTDGPPPHFHLMHDETFLVTSGVLHFRVGEKEWDAKAGEYVVVPVGVPHHFTNVSDEPVSFFTTFTSAFYIDSFRDAARLNAEGRLNAQTEAEVLMRYATVLCP